MRSYAEGRGYKGVGRNAGFSLHLFFSRACALLLGAVFIYASLSKLNEYLLFKTQLEGYPFFKRFAGILSWGIPLLEIAVALLLFTQRTRLTGLYASFLLMLTFTIFIYWLQHFTTYKSCSCGGMINRLSWTQHFWLNVLLTLLAGWGIISFSLKSSPAKK
jgi:hypothetical protein